MIYACFSFLLFICGEVGEILVKGLFCGLKPSQILLCNFFHAVHLHLNLLIIKHFRRNHSFIYMLCSKRKFQTYDIYIYCLAL